VQIFFRQGKRGSLVADIRTFSCKKIRIFRNFHTIRRVSQCGHFSDKGGPIFRDFVRTYFMLVIMSSFMSFCRNFLRYIIIIKPLLLLLLLLKCVYNLGEKGKFSSNVWAEQITHTLPAPRVETIDW